MSFATFKTRSEFIYQRYENIRENIATLKPPLSSLIVHKVSQYKAEIEKKISNFETLCDKLFDQDALPEDYNAAEMQQLQNRIANSHASIMAQINDLLPEAPPPSPGIMTTTQSLSFAQTSVLRLPRINLPEFSGDPAQWTHFHSFFESAVHKAEIPAIEKFSHLKSCLTGEALQVVSGVPISSANYDIAWETLVKVYQDNRRLTSLHLGKILDLPNLVKADAKSLRSFLSVFNENKRALALLDYIIEDNNLLLVAILLRKMDEKLRTRFEDKYSNKDHPLLSHIETFLERECKKLETTAYSITKDSTSKDSTFKPNSNFSSKPSPKPNVTPYRKPSHSYLSTSDNQRYKKCNFCEANDHKIYYCDQFKSLSPNERYDFIRKSGYCTNCMGTKHSYRECPSNDSCSKCQKKHHSLLHFDQNLPSLSTTNNCLDTKSQNARSTRPHTQTSGTRQNQDNGKASVSNDSQTTLSCQLSNSPNVLLGTAIVRIKTADRQFITARAVIDFGSQVSILTSQCFKLLKLPLQPKQTDIAGLAGNTTPSHGIADLTVVPRMSIKPPVHITTVIMDTITAPLPSANLNTELPRSYRGLNLADPDFHVSSKIDLLLGADVAPQIFRNGLLHFPTKPSCFNSIFGWIIIGPTHSKARATHATSLLTSATASQNLDSLLRKFWELEEPPPANYLNPDDEFCEEYFKKTTYRDSTGRYMVSYPFADSPEELSTNRDSSLRRYCNLEHRLEREPELKLEYNSFFEEYLSLEHMYVADSPVKYVIPHHPVVKSSSTTTKVRAVFDGSNVGRSGKSLNSLLHKGPNMLKNISEIIINFRTFKIVLCADIKMMYRQILVNTDHRKFQHIFWRPAADSPIVEYELNTVTYGLGPSAFLSQRVLIQLALDEGADYPLAAKSILHNTYVDNFATGADSEEEAALLLIQLLALLLRGGFELRKWYSNFPQLLKNIPESDLEKSTAIQFSDEDVFLVLGLLWLSDSDAFTYSVECFPDTTLITKRNALIYLARVFDPMQWLAPVTLWIKHFIQTLWKLGLDWDAEVPSELETAWRDFVSEFPALNELRIPRHIPRFNHSTHLIGFADASAIGYGCVIYLVTCCDDSSPNSIHLIASKAKPSPMKVVTIPRLELCAANLLAKLYSSLISFLHDYNLNIIRFYSDSATVLHWLRKPAYELKTFVANRTTQILEITQPERWHYIESKNNPADILSRGSSPRALVNSEMWWSGPAFFKNDPESWPTNPLPPLAEELPETKTVSLNVIRATLPENYLIKVIESFNSYPKLTRVFAFIIRFITKVSLKRKLSTRAPVFHSSVLSLSEIKSASCTIIKLVQQHYFSAEFKLLSNGEQCSKSLRPLSPFVDSLGYLRVGGRLRHSTLQYDSKFPFLIPQRSHLASLLIDHYHLVTIHGGLTATQHMLQRKFWIIGARALTRNRIFHCSICYLFKATPLQPKMADLPTCRLFQVRAFHKVGVDFAGPYFIKEHTRRNARTHKGYLCVFVCLSSKAVHLEIATELSTQNFIDAFDRFIARRGLPSSMHSDCGTNFVGCANKLKQLYNLINESSDIFHKHLASRQVEWIFNPPASPNFGGLWEAAVKSCKHHIVRALEAHPLTYEEFLTLICKVEATLNSRPLCNISSDPNDGSDYLTPGHFLIGAPLLELPDTDLTEIPENRLKRWQWIRQCHQSLWKRWSNEYLQQLTRRNKWSTPSPTLKVGDLVRVLGLRTPPTLWPLGRITELFPGKDGISRSAKVRVLGTELHRPLSKLVPVPLDPQ